MDDVADFHVAFDAPIAETVINEEILASDLARRRIEFQQEEMDEMWEAYHNNDPVAFADAVVDQLYFLYGTALALGIPLEACWNEVHRSNMAKIWPDGKVHKNPETGKVLKPDDWQEPNLALVLALADSDDQLFGLLEPLN